MIAFIDTFLRWNAVDTPALLVECALKVEVSIPALSNAILIYFDALM